VKSSPSQPSRLSAPPSQIKSADDGSMKRKELNNAPSGGGDSGGVGKKKRPRSG